MPQHVNRFTHSLGKGCNIVGKWRKPKRPILPGEYRRGDRTMTNIFQLRLIECRKSNEDDDELVLRADGVELWKGVMEQGQFEWAGAPDYRFDGHTHITLYEEDSSSRDDFIGEFFVYESGIDREGERARLPEEGRSDFNGIYFITYDVKVA
jgi:hypothetical protein